MFRCAELDVGCAELIQTTNMSAQSSMSSMPIVLPLHGAGHLGMWQYKLREAREGPGGPKAQGDLFAPRQTAAHPVRTKSSSRTKRIG